MAISAAVITFFKWLGVDMAGDVIWKGLKEASKAMMDAFSKETGKVIGTAAVDKALEAFKNLLPASEDDERMIREALGLIRDPDVKEAWFDLVNSFDDILNPEKGRLLKEYYRRLVIGETPQKTMATIIEHAGMPKPLWDKFQKALDIKFKADQKALTPFRDWAKTKGSSIASVINRQFNELDGKFTQTATELRSWREQRRIDRGQV